MDNSDLFTLCLNTAALLAQGTLQDGFCARLSARPRQAGLAAAVAVCIAQLSFGILDSVQTLLLPLAVGGMLVYFAAVLALAAACALCALCYTAALRLLEMRGGDKATDLLPLPLLFFLAAALYVRQTAYTRMVYNSDPAFLRAQTVLHTALLGLQALGLAALFCTLYACRAVRRGFESEAALRSLRQAAAAQKSCLAGAAAREAQTRAFRHDIQNHLTVLDGLLQAGPPQAARACLQKLRAASAGLSPPCHTGSPADHTDGRAGPGCPGTGRRNQAGTGDRPGKADPAARQTRALHR